MSWLTDYDQAEVERISAELVRVLVGKNIYLSMVAAVSVAATSAHLIAFPKLELQKMLIRACDKRAAEDRQRQTDIPPAPAGGKAK